MDKITAREVMGDLQAMSSIGNTINSWNSAQNAGQKLTQLGNIASYLG